MEIGHLLVEQRRTGDEFRVVEKSLQLMRVLLAGRGIDPGARAKLEAGVTSSTAELMRLGQRMLDLDASVTAASHT
jgi:hypothetical protein